MKLGPPIYTWQEVVTITGVSRRTLREMVVKGVIPPACRAGRLGPHWSEDHVRLIRKVLKAREQNVTYADLAERFKARERRA